MSNESGTDPAANAPAALWGGESPDYQRLIQDLPEAFYVCDKEGRVQFFNEAAVEIWGRRPTVGVDRWCGSFRIFKPDGTTLGLDECPMAVALKEGRSVRDVEIVIERPDGTRRNVLPYPMVIRDRSGQTIGAINMLIDTTGRRQKDELIRTAAISQARLAAIVESSDDAIIGKTLQGIITSWNRAAERLFGYTAQEAVGQSILLIVPKDRYEEETRIITGIRSGQRIDHIETKRQTKSGELRDISLTVSPVRDASGVIVGASKIARDITDKRRVDEQREKFLEAERHAREEAQRVNRMKDEFLATLSHELRTPLNAVMGWAQIMANGDLRADEVAEAGAVIERNARMQKQLIDDLLDMSRIISGKLRLDVQRIEPTTLVESAIDTVRQMAELKGVRIEQVLDPLSGIISGDPSRLHQIVWNLLTNAIKFTPKGGKVQVILERVNSHIELTIADTGQGIKPEFLSQLFNRFSQADASTNRQHGGLGLGLAIVKQLVELHGGSVRAKSDGDGLGAAFIVHLPVLIVSHDENEDRAHPRSSSLQSRDTGRVDLSGLKVLVVDDEPDARALIERLLRDCEATVSTAESASTALASLERDVPDVLVSDIGMPGTDGYDFLRMVRTMANETARRTPAIALTAFARSEDRTRALRAGYIAHVAKPVEPSELLATIAVIAGRNEKPA